MIKDFKKRTTVMKTEEYYEGDDDGNKISRSDSYKRVQ